MTEIFNKNYQKELRRKLRKAPVRAEKELWQQLRNKRTGYKFKRQFGIGINIVDFYCPRLRLVIEVDGATHSTDEEIKFDKERQNYLEELGLVVLRYNNYDVYNNLERVVGSIVRKCKKLENK